MNKLLKTHTGESNNLEFKEKWIETDKLAKIVISIINSGGGVIIFGIKEKKDDKIFLNTGLSKADIQDKTDMMKKLNSYIQNVFYEIRDALLKILQTGTVLMDDYPHFFSAFGRGQQYMAFVKK